MTGLIGEAWCVTCVYPCHRELIIFVMNIADPTDPDAIEKELRHVRALL